MRWMNFAVCAGFSWPDEPVQIPFEGRIVVLQPLSEELSCTASIFDPNGFEFDVGATILSEFLSRLSWSREGGIEELFAIGTNNEEKKPGRLGRGSYQYSCWANVEPWPFLYLPNPNSGDAKLALALYREAMSLNSVYFSFLSYFKILNITMGEGKSQIDWINRNLSYIKYGRELERLNKLQSTISDIGNYLYVQGRCAVAHAYSSPIANSDNYADKRRLKADLPLIKELSAVFIEKELGIVSPGEAAKDRYEQCIASGELLTLERVPGRRAEYVPYSVA